MREILSEMADQKFTPGWIPSVLRCNAPINSISMMPAGISRLVFNNSERLVFQQLGGKKRR